MSEYTIQLSPELYRKAQQFAEANAKSVDDFVQTQVQQALENPRNALPLEEREALHALQYLGDDILWMVAREQMPQAQQEHLIILMDKNTHGTISPTEKSELEALVENGQQRTLRKAEAMKLLNERRHEVTLDKLA